MDRIFYGKRERPDKSRRWATSGPSRAASGRPGTREPWRKQRGATREPSSNHGMESVPGALLASARCRRSTSASSSRACRSRSTARRAEGYYARHPCIEELLGKPLTKIADAPDLLFSFLTLVRGLELFPGARVLDFGAGTCWASHWLTQLGCQAIAVDPSRTALGLGRELYRQRPPFGEAPEPTFLPFDGRRFELDDASVDRVLCLDALHHVPNPAEVLAEIGRVLVAGGIAGFAEPRSRSLPDAAFPVRDAALPGDRERRRSREPLARGARARLRRPAGGGVSNDHSTDSRWTSSSRSWPADRKRPGSRTRPGPSSRTSASSSSTKRVTGGSTAARPRACTPAFMSSRSAIASRPAAAAAFG